MGWTYTDWSPGTNNDWALLANVNDFIKAFNERRAVAGDGAWSLKSAGDDVQGVGFLGNLQAGFYSGLFAVSHDAGVPRSAGYYEGETDIPTYASPWSDIFSAAGLSTTTWRAYTAHPVDDVPPGADQARGIGAGDIVGFWLFEDLQKCINVNIWAIYTTSSSGGTYEANTREGWGVGATWADAQADAEAAFNAEIKSYAPPACAYYKGEYIDDPLYPYRCHIKRTMVNFSMTCPTTLARDVEWYMKFAGLQTPDDNGDFPDHDSGEWHLWQTSPGETGLTISTVAPFGSLDMPNACDEPTLDNPTARGYDTEPDGMKCLTRWDVPGGFEYV